MTAPAVVLCMCGHAERMHERDDVGRGPCHHGGCDCSVFGESSILESPRPLDLIDQRPQPVSPPVPPKGFEVFKPNAAKAETKPFPCGKCDKKFDTAHGLEVHVARIHKTTTPVQYPCDQCDRSFGTKTGLEIHKGSSHKPTPDYVKIADEIEAKNAAERAPKPEPEPAPQDGAEPVEPSPMPSPVTRTSIWDERSVTVEFAAGSVTMSYQVDWAAMDFATRNWLTELDGLLMRLGRVDLFAATIGDPNADEYGPAGDA